MKILLTTLGSLGDLHPYIAVASGLRDCGHAVTLATSELYRSKVEGEGLCFHAIRPDLAGLIDDPASIRKAFHHRTGTEYIIRRMFLPAIEQGFEDTLAAARDADLIVSHPIAFATPVVADYLGKPWVSVALAPISLISAHDPPSISGAGFLEVFRNAGPRFWRFFWNVARFQSRGWAEPIHSIRKRLGLRPDRNPVIDGTLSPFGTLALFSKVLAQPQPDWPVRTTVTGFPFYDRLEPGVTMSTELRDFLASGPPPVIFTLGSSAVFDAGLFYEQSTQAARLAGLRAVLLTGRSAGNRPDVHPGDDLFIADYAPYSELFPHAAAIVHQGGVGTTAQALRAGRPMIVMPYSHDQPDNARRVTRLGVARVIPRRRFRAETAARELRELLSGQYDAQARRIALEMSTEDGVRAACEALETVSAVASPRQADHAPSRSGNR